MGYADNFWSCTRDSRVVVKLPFTRAGRDFKPGDKLEKLKLTNNEIYALARGGYVDFE